MRKIIIRKFIIAFALFSSSSFAGEALFLPFGGLETKIDLDKRLVESGVSHFYITPVEPSVFENIAKGSCIKLILWNRAANKVYPKGRYDLPKGYCVMEQNKSGRKQMDQALRRQGVSGGYSKDVLYEYWKEI